jgi:DNA/RNA endonuclease YhcR with UshA esterase domain
MECRRYFGFYSALFCLLVNLAGFLIAPGPVAAGVRVQPVITPEEAQQHIGETNIVCGIVASARYSDTTTNKPTYLNLARPYPNQAFTAVIPGPLRAQFKVPPEEFFKGKTICVTGPITVSRNKPQIVIDEPSQIRISLPVSPTTNQTAESTHE